MPPLGMQYDCEVKRSGRVNSKDYNGTKRVDLTLCRYIFQPGPQSP